MKRRNLNRQKYSAVGHTPVSGFSWNYFIITVLAGLVFAAGLFFAARQHFISIELGIKNAKLRSQLSELENEKRRLELERAVALSPAQLKKNARSLGFRDRVAITGSTEGSVPKAKSTTIANAELRSAPAMPASSTTRSERTISTSESSSTIPADGRSRVVKISTDRRTNDESQTVRRTTISAPTLTSVSAKLH